jgi:hypothetical protein
MTEAIVKTTVHGANISQEVYTVDTYGVECRIARQIINIQDEHVRKALIELGWTPPNKQGGK